MPRTTRSAALKEQPPATAPAVSAATFHSGTGTRRSLRGRASNVSSTGDLSTAPTSITSYSSGSEYATPLTGTSAAQTPAPSGPADSSSKSKTRIVVSIPSAKPPADSHRALRDSIYSMNSKRKREEIGDSAEEDFSDDSRSAQAARRLQNEEYRKASGPKSLSTSFPAGSRRIKRAALSSNSLLVQNLDSNADMDEDEDELELITRSSSRKGKAVERFPAHSSRPPNKKQKLVIQDSDDLDLDMDSESVLADNYDSDDSFAASGPRRRNSTRSAAQVKAAVRRKTKGSQEESLANSDEENNGETSQDVLSGYASDASLSSALTSMLSDFSEEDEEDEGAAPHGVDRAVRAANLHRRGYGQYKSKRRVRNNRQRLELHHPELTTMWIDLESMPVLKAGKAEQPKTISRLLKPFQLEGLAWMKEMEKTKWQGGLLGDEMGLGKTIQAVSLLMSDFPQKQPSLVLVPPVALMQWMNEIQSYTDGTLKTLVYHGTNAKSKGLTVAEIKKYNVIIMSYNSLESMYRKQEKGFKRKEGLFKEKSVIHQIQFHRVVLDEAHSIKTRTTMTAKACFALKVTYRWCLSGTPLQNRIGEFFSLIRFLNVQPFSCYLCKDCKCSHTEWNMDDRNKCVSCGHNAMRHVSVFNQELLNPIQRYGNRGDGAVALKKLRILTDRIMLRRLKKDNTDSMELPVKEIHVNRQFFGEAENDFANSIMTNGQRRFETYVSSGVLLNNYANIFGLIMQMRQVADHPDLILKKSAEGGQNILVCSICDEPAQDAIRSKCKHDFCRDCVASFMNSLEETRREAGLAKGSKKYASEDPRCPTCHDILSIDLEQPEIEQDAIMVKKSSIINRIKMENWTSSSKIELLVHELHRLRSDNASHKSIIFSQFTTMLQLIEWRLRRAGITSVMLDGSMTPAQRQASIEHFMTNVDVECFLVSLKAGGVALNLTEASRVFIVDPWWNPAAEWQSADRCHRIGQTRPCTITRLCIEDSVESRMVLLQEKKANMINSTINSDDKAMESLTPEDLQFLFRGS